MLNQDIQILLGEEEDISHIQDKNTSNWMFGGLYVLQCASEFLYVVFQIR